LLSLIYDLPEAITGDIDARLIARGKVTKEEKYRQEKKAMEKIKNIFKL